MELDPKKISTILKKLNGGKAKGNWIEASGFHVLSAVKLEKDNTFSDINGLGAPVKVFFNFKTGETRMYIANRLAKL